jgi:transposase
MKHYVEDDLGAASFLSAKGHRFVGLEPLSATRFGFKFEENDSGECARDAESYWTGGLVPGENLIHRLQQLKSLLRHAKAVRKDQNQDESIHQIPRN